MKAQTRDHPTCSYAHTGALSVNEEELVAKDAARISGNAKKVSSLYLQAGPAGSHFMIIEMAMRK